MFGLHPIRWIGDSWQQLLANHELRKLRKKYAPQVAHAAKNKDWNNREELLHHWSTEEDSLLHPIRARNAERLAATARYYLISVPSIPNSYTEQSDDWWPSGQTGEWLMTKALEDRLLKTVRDQRRAAYDEFRKWATFGFAIVGFFLAFYSLSIQKKQPDPCPRNYFRNDSGACVFALEKSMTLATPAPNEPKAGPSTDTTQSPNKVSPGVTARP
jgi:hypothetical protein